MKSYDDIDKEKKEEKHKEAEREIREGLSGLMSGVFDDFEDTIKRKKIEKELRESKRKKTFLDRLQSFFTTMFILGLGMLVVNLILGNLWLLRFFIKSFLGGW